MSAITYIVSRDFTYTRCFYSLKNDSKKNRLVTLVLIFLTFFLKTSINRF